MPKIRSHYDNLKVSRDAPPAVIKAAYRTLSQEYHPDRSTSPDASRIMTILNQSYDVLSDPAKRRAHDAWLTAQEAAQAERAASAHAMAGAAHQPSAHEPFHEPAHVADPAAAFAGPPPRPAARGRARRHRSHAGTYRFSPWVWKVAAALGLLTAVIIGGIVVGRGHIGDDAALPPVPLQDAVLHALPPVPVRSTPAAPAYQRTLMAPNGMPWPIAAGYLDGYPVGAHTGHSTLAIDNHGNRSDVYIKLLSLDPADGGAVRYLFVPAKGFFTMRDITPGRYALRYLNLDNGAAFQAEAFELTEEVLPGGVRASQDQLTLNSAREGNMRMQAVRAGQF